jgi:hypothetical protein
MFGILEHHVDCFILQYDFTQCHEVSMMQFAVQLIVASLLRAVNDQKASAAHSPGSLGHHSG